MTELDVLRTGVRDHEDGTAMLKLVAKRRGVAAERGWTSGDLRGGHLVGEFPLIEATRRFGGLFEALLTISTRSAIFSPERGTT